MGKHQRTLSRLLGFCCLNSLLLILFFFFRRIFFTGSTELWNCVAIKKIYRGSRSLNSRCCCHLLSLSMCVLHSYVFFCSRQLLFLDIRCFFLSCFSQGAKFFASMENSTKKFVLNKNKVATCVHWHELAFTREPRQCDLCSVRKINRGKCNVTHVCYFHRLSCIGFVYIPRSLRADDTNESTRGERRKAAFYF